MSINGQSVKIIDSSGDEKGTIPNPVSIDPTGLTAQPISAEVNTSFSPDPLNRQSGQNSVLRTDALGRLENRSTTLTDEGSFRDDFTGSSLLSTLTGTATLTNGSDSVIGVGTLFTTEVKTGRYIKKTTDGETLLVQVDSVISDTELILVSPYSGSTGSISIHITSWLTTTGAGSISVASSLLSIVSGTASGTVKVTKSADYGPYTMGFKTSISQRIANQTTSFGVSDNPASPSICADFVFSGTDSTAVTCRTRSSSNASDEQLTSAFLPNNITTTTRCEYVINVSNDQIVFVINGSVVANHRDHIQGAYDNLNTYAQIVNTAVVTTTTVAIDWNSFFNINQVEIANNFIGEPLVISPVIIRDTIVNSYSACITSLVVAATPTDVFTISGSASKTIKIKKIVVCGTQSSAASRRIVIIKRSTANTGGTSTTRTAVPLDSDSIAATATVLAYTVNPTLGTLIGNMSCVNLPVQAPAGGGFPVLGMYEFVYNINGISPLVLRGTSEVVSVNLDSVTSSGNVFTIFVEWTEE